MSAHLRCCIASIIAGSLTGILGGGGGMLLIPLLSPLFVSSPKDLFPVSLAIMLSICLTSLFSSISAFGIPFARLCPYCLGGLLGSILASLIQHRIPVIWLHRILGSILLLGGIQCIVR